MQPKRILLIQNNSRLATCFGEALAAAGFHVYAAADGPGALDRLEAVQPDLVILDVVLPPMDGADLVRSIRSTGANRALPILLLPGEVEPLILNALQSGATKALERFANPIGAMVKAAELALDPDATRLRGTCENSATGLRLSDLRVALPARVAELRRVLQSVSHHSRERQSVRDLFQETHNFAEEVALLGLRPLHRIAAALEALLYDLHVEPMQVNASTLRTIGQAIDLLAALLEEDRWTRTEDAPRARLLVVDDDANACQLITAALDLVDLAATSAYTPQASLEVLRDAVFNVIILDVGLPQMSGFDLCTRIRAIPEHEKTPVVFLTGMATFQNRVQSSLSGGNDFIGKPFNIRELGLKGLLWVMRGNAGLS